MHYDCNSADAKQGYHTGFPVWGLLLAVALVGLYILPGGIIYAMSAQQVRPADPAPRPCSIRQDRSQSTFWRKPYRAYFFPDSPSRMSYVLPSRKHSKHR